MNYNGMSYDGYQELTERIEQAKTVEELKFVLQMLVDHIFFNTYEDNFL